MDRATIFAALALKPVPYPSGDNPTLYLRPWTGAERAAFHVWRKDQPAGWDGLSGLNEQLFVRSVCDAAGALVFGIEDAAEIGRNTDGAKLEEIAVRVLELNGLAAGKVP